jgi:hypothetical protein
MKSKQRDEQSGRLLLYIDQEIFLCLYKSTSLLS